MKVLSLTESCASLIKEKKKLVETRSWKTEYRGELYIHASATSIPKNWIEDREFMSLMDSVPLNFGHIICKCNLTDCVYMTKEFVEYIKRNNKNKIGVCWDQVELERYYFKGNDWNIKTYFIFHYDNDKCPTHTFLNFEKERKYYWFEHSWEKFKGIHEYNSLKDLLVDVIEKFIKYELNNNYYKNNLCIYNYKKPRPHLNVLEFYKHCESGINISLEDI